MTLAVAYPTATVDPREAPSSELAWRINEAIQSITDELRKDGRRGEQSVLSAAMDTSVSGPPYLVSLTVEAEVYRRYFVCIDLFADTIAHKINALISDTRERVEAVEIKPAYPNPIDDHVLTMWGGGRLRVFLSYASTDRNRATPLADGLVEYGAKVFMAHVDIPQGTDWYSQLEQALDTMDCMVAFIGPDYDTSPTCNQEYGWARGRGIDVVTIGPKGSVPPGIMGKYQAIEVSSYQDSIKTVAEHLIPGCTTATQYKDAAKHISELRWEADWGNFRRAEQCVSNMIRDVGFLTRSQAREIVNIYNDDSQRGWGCNQVRYANGNQPNSFSETPERLIVWIEKMTGMVYEYKPIDLPSNDGSMQTLMYHLSIKRE